MTLQKFVLAKISIVIGIQFLMWKMIITNFVLLRNISLSILAFSKNQLNWLKKLVLKKILIRKSLTTANFATKVAYLVDHSYLISLLRKIQYSLNSLQFLTYHLLRHLPSKILMNLFLLLYLPFQRSFYDITFVEFVIFDSIVGEWSEKKMNVVVFLSPSSEIMVFLFVQIHVFVMALLNMGLVILIELL